MGNLACIANSNIKKLFEIQEKEQARLDYKPWTCSCHKQTGFPRLKLWNLLEKDEQEKRKGIILTGY